MRRSLLLFSLLAVAACDCGSPPPGRSCVVDSECPDGERCVDNMCVDGMMTVDTGTGVDTAPMCTDEDGDGYGEGPGCRGPDCDDTDRIQTGVEVCDGADNDCDGVIDNGVLNACGNCNPDCRADDRGVGTDAPFDPEMDESDGVGLDEDGSLILDSEEIRTEFIWIANTAMGTVTKVDTTTFEEVGRYRTGTDPSRTSVNSAGDVFVGNRRGYSLTKVSTLGEACPDTNGDGVITTSSGPADVLPVGQDDCVLWTTPLAGRGLIRAVAAQDVIGPDGERESFVWAGGYSGTAWKLDGETGAILVTTPAPNLPYGFALDAAGNLWSSGLDSRLGRIDTNRCLDDASCAGAVCGDDGADCVKQVIRLPNRGYGITVDFRQRVWLGGDTVLRYDPPTATFLATPIGGFSNGIAADARGHIWAVVESGAKVQRLDGETPSMNVAILVVGSFLCGVVVDAEGKIWGINCCSSNALVITPGDTAAYELSDYTVAPNIVPGQASPYTYSDMTGLQARLATNPRGEYRFVVEGCPEPQETRWDELRWDADTPPGTTINFRVRTADTRDQLETAEWVVIAMTPPDVSPALLGPALEAAGVTAGRYMMVEAVLAADRVSTTEVISPRLRTVNVTRICPPDFG